MMKLGLLALPQVERLERVVALTRSKVTNDDWSTTNARGRETHTRAATILGWLSFDGLPTAAGFSVALCSDLLSELAHAGVGFERSQVGREWLSHAGVSAACDLDPQTASAFLEAAADCRGPELARRAATLSSWITQMRAAYREREVLVAHLRTGETTAEEVDVLQRILALPCAGLVPARMSNWATRNQVPCLRDLALCDRDELMREPNLGRKTLNEVEELFRRRTGRTWDALRSQLIANPDSPRPSIRSGDVTPPDVEISSKDGWEQLRHTFPDSLRSQLIVRLDLSARVRKLCELLGFVTVGDLLAVPQATLLDAPNFSRRSLLGIITVLRDIAERFTADATFIEPTLDDHPDWLTLVRARLDLLRADDRLIFIRRSGLDGNAPQTLAELGDERGVTRERIRQLESRALKRLADDWWPSAIRKRIHSALGDRVTDLETLASDPFFSGIDEHDAFEYVLERVIDENLRVVDLEGRMLIGRIEQRALDKVMVTLRRELKNLAFPIPRAMLDAVIERHTAKNPGLGELVLAAIVDELTLVESSDGPVVMGFGSERHATMLAYLRASSAPVPVAELYERFGRGKLPEEVLYLERGLVGLPNHVPDFDLWMRRLVPLCIATMMASDPARQWSTGELRELIAEQARLPSWLNAWHLAALIRVDGRVRYLGRLRVALIHEEAPTDRAYVRDLVVEVLREHGSPMIRDALLEALRVRGACSDLTFHLMILNPPFIPLDDEHVGLVERDVPGGEAAISTAVDTLVAELERVDRGLVPTEALGIVRALKGDFSSWTSAMVSAAVRQSGMAVLNRSGSIGLAGWSSDRLATRQSTVRELVDAGDGQAVIANVLATIQTRFGTPCTRPTLYNLAQSVGARLRGDLVIDERLLVALAPQTSQELPDPLELPGFPAAAVDEFLRATEQEGSIEDLRRAIDKHVAAYHRHAEDDPRLAPSEVEAVARASRALLNRAESTDGAPARLSLAAVRYFVTRDDAEMDFEVGGLDDDIQVINAISTHLGFVDCRVEYN